MSNEPKRCELCGEPIEEGEREFWLIEELEELEEPVLHLCQWCGLHLVMGKREQ